jgi:hypothetical protein
VVTKSQAVDIAAMRAAAKAEAEALAAAKTKKDKAS